MHATDHNPDNARYGTPQPIPTRVDQMRSQVVRRPSHGRTSTVGKIASASLATITCIGLAGVLAVRAAQDSAAAGATGGATDASASTSGGETTTSTGLTQAQLDDYARQLQDEAQRLADYREQLIEVAGALQKAGTDQGLPVATSGQVGPGSPQAAPRPAAQPPSTPAQGQSQGS